MATISNTPRPGYVWDSTDNVWYPIGVGGHSHPDYITQATAVNPTLIDAKGDIITATAADTPARLAVGNNGETLVADSSATTGLRYTGGTVIANPVLNSAMQVWQRGTSVSVAASTNAYTADRWYAATGANQACTISRQATGDTTNLPNIQYAMRVQRNSGQTGTGAMYFSQSFESINSIPFAGKTVTLSFYARAGANYSSGSNALTFYISSGTGTDQNIGGAGFTGQTVVANVTATLTTTWQRFSVSGTVGSTATQIGIYNIFAPTGTAGTNDYFEMTGVQVDIGSVALPFRTNGATIQGELAACQRYCYRRSTTGNGYGMATITANGANDGYARLDLPVRMRTTPTATLTGTASNYRVYISGLANLTAISLQEANTDFALFAVTSTGNMVGVGAAGWLASDTSSNGYIQLNAEL